MTLVATALPDSVAGSAVAGAERLTASGLALGAAYLLAHGVVKVVLVLASLRNKLCLLTSMRLLRPGSVSVSHPDHDHRPASWRSGGRRW